MRFRNAEIVSSVFGSKELSLWNRYCSWRGLGLFVCFWWWETTNFLWSMHSKYSYKNTYCINCCWASAAKIIKANLHKRAIGTEALDSFSVNWLACLLVTSLVRRLLRHPPPGTSPAPQHSFNCGCSPVGGTYRLCRSCITRQRFNYILQYCLLSEQWIFMVNN